ncbi:RadC family protein [Candidatus Xianfuyuplasma coldseepsis]|uniref:JAB domain-containing protein n=1 Tax=Candidatus Xianfuyuplasma coldseepsis TaxID=2782163 RepID=A0A7L7KSJ4_9MOLU|nr:DNA repair protein RadC [Xianfuyuplasma coldseepsis]QMS85790.1 JAB domain-containing protein [Xianfuyuplasma coldseepsis]
MFTIKEMPLEERPRERLAKYDAETIQTHELIAIILRTGTTAHSVLELAKQLLYQYGSLKELASSTYQEYQTIPGIGFSKAIQLKAAFELGRRSVRETFGQSIHLRSPEAIYLFCKDQLEMKTQEHLLGLYLNTKGELLKKEVLFIGSLNTSVIHPRAIFKHAVLNSAANIIIVHNHPSGDPTPSKADLDVTSIIVDNGKMMDIPVLDHVIIGRDRYFSFKEKGAL